MAKKIKDETCRRCGAKLVKGSCPVEALPRIPRLPTTLANPFRSNTMLEVLVDIRGFAAMERAGFTGTPGFTCTGALGADGDKVTEWIKERTRLYRETWLIPQIDALILRERFKKHASAKRAVRS